MSKKPKVIIIGGGISGLACGDFYSYPGLESAVYTGLKVAEEIIKVNS